MLLINDPSDAPAGPKVVAIGSFDGLHLGHQHLIHQARQAARSLHAPLLVYTFDPPARSSCGGRASSPIYRKRSSF